MADTKNRYSQIIEAIFSKYFQKGLKEISFERSDIDSEGYGMCNSLAFHQ
jgi:hypothetical protein